MGVIEDVRKVVQDIVTPDLKALAAEMKASREATDLKLQALSEKTDARIDALAERMEAGFKVADARIDALAERMEAGFRATDERMAALSERMESRFHSLSERMNLNFVALNAKIESNHATILYTLNIDKRLEALERVQGDPRREAAAS